MARTSAGKKTVSVRPPTRRVNSKPLPVRRHRRLRVDQDRVMSLTGRVP